MGILHEFGNLLSPNDPELVEKTLARIAEQDTWNDVFSTKLIELLDNIDGLKSELRQKIRAVESASQAAASTLVCAETAHQQASEKSLEAKRLLDDSARQLDHAREFAEVAERRLRTAEASLTLAGQT